MLGFSNEVLLTMQVVDIDPDYPPDVWKSWWDKMRVDRYNVVETRHKRDNGGDMWAEVTVHFVEHDRKEYIVGVTRDISQRKEAARQVKESEARFRTIADEAPAIIWMTDENKSSIWVNRQCEVYSGVPRERFYQSTWKDFFTKRMLRLQPWKLKKRTKEKNVLNTKCAYGGMMENISGSEIKECHALVPMESFLEWLGF